MSKTFVKDPRSVAKPGDIVRVKVLEVDAQRKQIALTLRLDDEVQPTSSKEIRSAQGSSRHTSGASRGAAPEQRRETGGNARAAAGGALGDALLAAMRASKDKTR